MHKKNVPFVLAGSIRDDGPLPDVIVDVMEAQDAMREHIAGCSMVLMIATLLHSIAVGNFLPSNVKTVCVDINPANLTKLMDRGQPRRSVSYLMQGHSFPCLHTSWKSRAPTRNINFSADHLFIVP